MAKIRYSICSAHEVPDENCSRCQEYIEIDENELEYFEDYKCPQCNFRYFKTVDSCPKCQWDNRKMFM